MNISTLHGMIEIHLSPDEALQLRDILDDGSPGYVEFRTKLADMIHDLMEKEGL